MSRGLRNSKILLHSWIKTRTVLNVCRISATLSSSGSKNFSVSPTTSIQKTQPVETCSKNDGGFPDFREFDVPTLITAIFVIVSILMILALFAKAFYEYLQEGDETLKLHGPDTGSPKVSFWKKIWNEEESGKKKKDIKGVQSEGTDQQITGTKEDSENTPSKKAGPDEKQKKEEADEKWSFWKKKGVKQEDEKNGKDDEIKIKQEDEKNGKNNEESSWQWWKRKEDKGEKEDKPDIEKTEDKESREGESKEWFWKTKKDEKELVQISKIDDANKKDESVNKNDSEKKDEVSKKDEKDIEKKDGSPKKQEKSAKKVDNFYKYEDGYVDGYNTTKSSKVSAFVNQVIQLTIVVLTLIF